MTSPILPSALTTTAAANPARVSHIKEPIDQAYAHDQEQPSTTDSLPFSLIVPQQVQQPVYPQQLLPQNSAVIGDTSAQMVSTISRQATPIAGELFSHANPIESTSLNTQLGLDNSAKPLHFASATSSAANPLTQQRSNPTSVHAAATSSQPLTYSTTAAAHDKTHTAALVSNFANTNAGAAFNGSAVKPDSINPFLSASQLASALIAKQVDSASIDTIESAHQLINTNTRAQSAVAQWGPVSVSQAAPMLQQAQEMLSPLREQLRFQIDQQIKQAELRLDPPELGKIELNVRLDGDKLHIQMYAANASVRDALLTGLDRLRAELAADHGGQIDVDISQGESQKEQTQQGSQSTIAAANLQGAQPMTADTSQQDHVDLLA
ncbi:flagellar hook-length control protein FliK [Shewanella abyssi]|uniref:flagellar hook-length control protein FliK n=1 Tax=Shewanella abyssi TaxID=311789 RepID=UPI00200FB0A0|nr:flagellar hook-length control protein FliK [Shewanella abyssi]MCL1050871.1 flagellar hook-length control protein FliK [Shewanella abyssi]